MTTPDKDFDVVLYALQKHIDVLWNMTKNKEEWGMMDHIRLQQIDELKKAMDVWKRYKAVSVTLSHGYTDIVSDGGMDPRNK